MSWLGNAAELLPQLVERGVRPDAVTDQTSAHDPVHGYLPIGWTVEQWLTAQKQHPEKVRDAAKQSMRVHVEARSEERRVGKACVGTVRSRGLAYHSKKKKKK